MPPQLALFLTIIFIGFLVLLDSKRKPHASRALWIPSIWIMIMGSRPVSVWLHTGPVSSSEMAYVEGDPVNRAILFALIALGLFVLSKRKIRWTQMLKANAWIALFFLYGAISIFWSDYTVVSLKRWIKTAGNLVMILIVLTDNDPVQALKTLIRRCAYVLIPLSILCIKYYPHVGRSYNIWTGEVSWAGITSGKNQLGNLCLVCILFFTWDLLAQWYNRRVVTTEKREYFLAILLLCMMWWLLIRADSATSLACLVFGLSVLLVTGIPSFRRNTRLIEAFLLIVCFFGVAFQLSFDITQNIISGLGRDSTLTGRTELWNDVINMVKHPVIGEGYESFWLGERMAELWQKHWWHPNQAHSGYVETYLNLGLIGLGLLTGIVFASYRNIRRSLTTDFEYGKIRIVFLLTTLLYNVTEAAFKELHLMWFVFLLVSMDLPRRRKPFYHQSRHTV